MVNRISIGYQAQYACDHYPDANAEKHPRTDRTTRNRRVHRLNRP